MKRKNAFPFQFRILSVVLAILIMIMSLPVNALAEDNVFSHDNNEGYLAEQSAPEIFEVLTSRTLNSKTIHLADGSFYLATYNTDVHRITEDGSYAEIDNTLIKTNDGIINSDKNILLASEMKESQAVLTVFHSNEAHEEKSVSFTILGNVRPTKGRIENPEQKPDDDLAEYEKLTVLSKINSSVTYENVYKNTDIEYFLHGSDVKENIIVKDRCEEYTYAFALALSGFTAEKTDTGEIIINDSGTGETVYRIPAPVMWDSAFNSSSDIEVFINEVNPENIGQEYSEKTNAYVLSYTASSSWINDPSRSFPVTIDPPLYSSSSNIIDLDLTTQNPDRSSPSDNTVYAGREWRTYLKLTTLPTLPFLARITKAEITMTYFSSGADDDG